MRKVLFLLSLLLLLSMTSCSINKPGKQADLSGTQGLTTSSEWAVVSSPYAAFRSRSSIEADVVSHGRQGDICEITGKKIEKNAGDIIIWYKFTEGWLSESDIMVCSNRMQAEKASADMLNGI